MCLIRFVAELIEPVGEDQARCVAVRVVANGFVKATHLRSNGSQRAGLAIWHVNWIFDNVSRIEKLHVFESFAQVHADTFTQAFRIEGQ